MSAWTGGEAEHCRLTSPGSLRSRRDQGKCLTGRCRPRGRIRSAPWAIRVTRTVRRSAVGRVPRSREGWFVLRSPAGAARGFAAQLTLALDRRSRDRESPDRPPGRRRWDGQDLALAPRQTGRCPHGRRAADGAGHCEVSRLCRGSPTRFTHLASSRPGTGHLPERPGSELPAPPGSALMPRMSQTTRCSRSATPPPTQPQHRPGLSSTMTVRQAAGRPHRRAGAAAASRAAAGARHRAVPGMHLLAAPGPHRLGVTGGHATAMGALQWVATGAWRPVKARPVRCPVEPLGTAELPARALTPLWTAAMSLPGGGAPPVSWRYERRVIWHPRDRGARASPGHHRRAAGPPSRASGTTP